MGSAHSVELGGGSGRDIEEFDSRDSTFQRFGLFDNYANQFVEKGGSHRKFVEQVEDQLQVAWYKRGFRYRRLQKPG